MRRDGIVTTVRQGPFFLPTNAGKHKYRGVETALRWLASSKATTYLNASFYRNRFGDFVIESSGGDTVLTGNRLPISPDRVINGGATFSPVPFVDFSVDVKHVGTVQIDQRNTFQLDPYTLVDAAVTWRRGPLRVTLSGHNLFNTEYFWNGDISSGQSADSGRPRQVLITTSFIFK
jgi:outer membrane receptor for ferrienterochelin and colicin